MKRKQAWKVMGAVLAGALVLSDASPLLASGTGSGMETTVSSAFDGTKMQEEAASKVLVYVNTKTGSDAADGSSAEQAVRTIAQAEKLLEQKKAELLEKDPEGKTEQYLIFTGMTEDEFAAYQKRKQKTDAKGNVIETGFPENTTVVTEEGFAAILETEKQKAEEAAQEENKLLGLVPGAVPQPDTVPQEDVKEEPTITPGGEEIQPDSAVTPEAGRENEEEPGATPEPDQGAKDEESVIPDPGKEPQEEPTVTPEEPAATPQPDDKKDEMVTPEPDQDTKDDVTVTPEEPTAAPEPDQNAGNDAEPTPEPDQNAKDDAKQPEPDQNPTEDIVTTPTETPEDPSLVKPEKKFDVLQPDSEKTTDTDNTLENLMKKEAEKEQSGLLPDTSFYQTTKVPTLKTENAAQTILAEADPQEEEKAAEEQKELAAAADKTANLSADEMTASVSTSQVSVQKAAGTILVGPDNYGTNKVATPTPSAGSSSETKKNSDTSSSGENNTKQENNIGSNSQGSAGTATTKTPQKKTQTLTSIKSVPVNTGDETVVLPLAISSVLSGAVMALMVFLQMQAKRAKSAAAWLEFKKSHPLDE